MFKSIRFGYSKPQRTNVISVLKVTTYGKCYWGFINAACLSLSKSLYLVCASQSVVWFEQEFGLELWQYAEKYVFFRNIWFQWKILQQSLYLKTALLFYMKFRQKTKKLGKSFFGPHDQITASSHQFYHLLLL